MGFRMLPKPKLHDYPSLEAYLEELVDWKFDCPWLREMGIDLESDISDGRARQV